MSGAGRNSRSPIKVYVRQRPPSITERVQNYIGVVRAIYPHEIVLKLGSTERRYTCDYVFGQDADQADIFKVTLAPMINSVIAGYNCTLFAHGGVGTGKTYTMFGDVEEPTNPALRQRHDNTTGLILRAAHHLFMELGKPSLRAEYSVAISCIEIFKEEVRDLFSDNAALRVYDDPLNKGSVCMKDMSKISVFDVPDVVDWINIALLTHQKAISKYSIQTSRSHVIFAFYVNIREITARGEGITKSGRLCLVDLAANERVSRENLREFPTVTRSINSLSPVIKAVAQRVQHVPYKLSMLTRILQDSFSGNTKTAMIVTFSPTSRDWNETIASLNLGLFARTIVTNTHVNTVERQADLMKELDDGIDRLRNELGVAKRYQEVLVTSEAFPNMTSEAQEVKQKILELVGKISELENHRNLLDLQYSSLERSFQKTTDYLLRETLEVGQHGLREEDVRMHTAREEYRFRTRVNNTLLDVYNHSTRNGEIYFRKHNVQILKEMLSTTNTTQDHRALTLVILNELEQYIAYLSNNMQNVNVMDQVASDMRCCAEEYIILLNEMLRSNNDDHLRTLQSFILHICGRSFRNQAVVDYALEDIRRFREMFMREMAVNYMAQNATETAHQSELTLEVAKRRLLDITTLLRQRREVVREEREQDEAAAVFTTQDIIRAQQERQALLNRAFSTERAMANVCIRKDRNVGINPGPVQQPDNDSQRKPRKIVNTSLLKANDALKQAQFNESLMRNHAASDHSAGNQMNTAATVNVVAQRNGNVCDVMDTLRSTLATNAGENTMPATDEAGASMSALSEQQQNIHLKRSFSDVVKNLNKSSARFNGLDHAGDTSVKKTHNCPIKFVGSKFGDKDKPDSKHSNNK